jgi:hypothetical protein
VRNDEAALAGGPDDLHRTAATTPDHAATEYRGGPIATVRLILDAYVRSDPVWDTIEPSRPSADQPPSSAQATKSRGDEE